MASAAAAAALLVLAFFPSLLFSVARAQQLQQGRAPHGLVYQNSVPLSPSSFEFFHPLSPNYPKTGYASPLSFPTASSSTDSSQANILPHENELVTPQVRGSVVGVGGVINIMLGFAFVVFLAIGVFYVRIARRTKPHHRGSSIGPADV